MSMRSQVYEWDAARETTPQAVTGYLGNRTSIFVGGLGNNITKPAETTATEFVVIEDIATTASLGTLSTITAGTVVRGLVAGVNTAAVPVGNGICGPRS